jgi:hypothetical protein
MDFASRPTMAPPVAPCCASCGAAFIPGGARSTPGETRRESRECDHVCVGDTSRDCDRFERRPGGRGRGGSHVPRSPLQTASDSSSSHARGFASATRPQLDSAVRRLTQAFSQHPTQPSLSPSPSPSSSSRHYGLRSSIFSRPPKSSLISIGLLTLLSVFFLPSSHAFPSCSPNPCNNNADCVTSESEVMNE